MRSIVMAMTWEHVRKNVWLIPTAILGPWAFLALPLGGLLFNPAVAGNNGFTLVLWVFALIGFVPVALRQYDGRKDRVGFPLALYTRPISTASMVALRMALDVATPIVIYLGLALLVWATSGATLPLILPILFLAMIAAWMEAIFWSLSGSPLLLAMIGVGIEYILFLWLFIGPLTENPDKLDVTITWRVLSAIPLTILAFVAAVIGVRFDRRGERISLARAAEWIGDRIYAMRRKDRDFRSARAAQFWLEWHRKGFMLPALNLLALAVYATLAFLTKWISLVDGLAFLWGLAIFNAVFFPILMAILVNLKERGVSQDLFWATRPLSDNALLLIRLKVAISSLLASWGVWLAGAVVISGLLWVTDQSESLVNDAKNFTWGLLRPVHPDSFPTLMAGLVALNIWTALGIIGSLHMTGRRWVAMLWMVPLWIYPLWRIFVRQGLITPDTTGLIEAAAPWIIGILCLAGTGMIYWAALRMGRIGRWLGLTVLGIYLVAFYLFYPYPDGWAQVWIDQNPGAVVLYAGLRALFLLPLALGPLAVAWNRHR